MVSCLSASFQFNLSLFCASLVSPLFRLRPCDRTSIFHRLERASFREILRLRGDRSGEFRAYFHSFAPDLAQICCIQCHRTKQQFLRSFSHPRNTLNLVTLQLAFHDTWNSAMSAGCGALVALLYWSVLSPLQRFRMPGQRLFVVSKATECGKCVAACLRDCAFCS